MSKRKLLLADDSVTIQKVVNLTFADEGFEVISVGDGNSAIDKLREESPDIVMADVNMPGLNGYEICEKVKSDNGDGTVPVILLVGSFEPFDEDEAKRVGADDYLTKPFQSISQLVSSVNQLVISNGSEEMIPTEELPVSEAVTASEIESEEDSTEPFDFESDELVEEVSSTAEEEVEATDSGETFESLGEVEELETDRITNEGSEGFQIVSDPKVEKESTDFQPDSEFNEEFSSDEVMEEVVVNDSGYEVDDRKDDVEISNENYADSSPAFSLDDSSPLELSFIQESFKEDVLPSDDELVELSNGEEPATEDSEIVADPEEDEPNVTYLDDEVSDEQGDSIDVADSDSSNSVDEIVRKVVEVMSDDVIERVAREVVPDRVEAIVRELVEEKMKD